jgi:transposase InsO family protein
MGILYHKNAKTTIHTRRQIKASSESIEELSKRLKLNKNTILKWKNREELEDRSCRPFKLKTVLSELDEWIICEVRKSAEISIDDLGEVLKPFMPHLNRHNIYRCLKRHGLSQLRTLRQGIETKEVKKKFKTYEPGYIHVDIKKMPKLKGETEKKYLFVSIDRATRYVYISLKVNKEAKSAVEFLNEITEYYPYHITIILTDNGKEFTDKFIKGRKEPSGNHKFDKACKQHQIEHRLTRPYTPKTNGMVERFNGRIAEILSDNYFDSYEQLSQCLNYYLKCYNYFNKQKVLNYRTPVDMIRYWYEKNHKLFKDNCDILFYNLSQPDMCSLFA